MSEWQPIATAPKDGASILCFAPITSGRSRICILRWDDGTYGNREGAWRTDVVSFIEFEPTHWIHLPSPPKEE